MDPNHLPPVIKLTESWSLCDFIKYLKAFFSQPLSVIIFHMLNYWFSLLM